jgi:hypothetical protein
LACLPVAALRPLRNRRVGAPAGSLRTPGLRAGKRPGPRVGTREAGSPAGPAGVRAARGGSSHATAGPACGRGFRPLARRAARVRPAGPETARDPRVARGRWLAGARMPPSASPPAAVGRRSVSASLPQIRGLSEEPVVPDGRRLSGRTIPGRLPGENPAEGGPPILLRGPARIQANCRSVPGVCRLLDTVPGRLLRFRTHVRTHFRTPHRIRPSGPQGPEAGAASP